MFDNTVLIPELKQGEDIFTLTDLFRLVCRHKGLVYAEHGSYARTELIATYPLDNNMLDFLKCHGMREYPCQSPSVRAIGFSEEESWTFPDDRDDDSQKRVFTLYAGFAALRPHERGLSVMALARTFLAAPIDRSSAHGKLFQLFAEHRNDVPPIVRELAGGGRRLTVLWHDLGLGGIRTISDLFDEFRQGNDEIKWLAQVNERLFQPAPYSRQSRPAGEESFIVEPAQPKVLKIWAAQLEGFRTRIQLR